MEQNKEIDKKILDLVKPEYIKRIPFFVRKHATTRTCELILREFPETYKEFGKEEILDETKEQMSKIVNDIFEARMKKHDL